jgi:SpoVK/Ycf46/Vps4 family AAA+-type ATPase
MLGMCVHNAEITMAKADHIKRLFASFGRPDDFRAVATKIIEDEHRKGHIPLANALKRTLDTHVRVDPKAPGRPTQPGALIHADLVSDPALELVDILEPRRNLTDIVLSVDAKASFDRLIEEQRRADELRRHHLPVRCKLLLCGPPGCGKTLSAEVIAKELDLPLVTARIDMLISSLLGQTASNLRRLFDYATRQPCVLFLDEFDALARSRTDSGEHNELRRVVNSLLGMVERFKSRGILIAATNLETTLDEAIWRRFDDVVNFTLPSNEDIARQLVLLFKNYPVNFDLATLVPKLDGFSFADIERVACDGIKTSILKKRKAVTETDVAAAVKAEAKRRPTRKRDRNART